MRPGNRLRPEFATVFTSVAPNAVTPWSLSTQAWSAAMAGMGSQIQQRLAQALRRPRRLAAFAHRALLFLRRPLAARDLLLRLPAFARILRPGRCHGRDRLRADAARRVLADARGHPRFPPPHALLERRL